MNKELEELREDLLIGARLNEINKLQKVYYKWEKVEPDIIKESQYITDDLAEREGYARDGWVKIVSSKRVI